MRKRVLLWLFVVLACAYFIFRMSGRGGLYAKIEIEKSVTNTPVLEIEVENAIMPVKLDLGFTSYFGLNTEVLQKVLEKSFLQRSWKYSFRGNRYEHDLFKISKIRMGDLTFSESLVAELPEGLNADAVVGEASCNNERPAVGAIGWKLFQNLVLYLNLSENVVVICDNLKTFQKHEHSTNKYVRVPLQLDRGVVEVVMESANGTLRCVLDTGSSWNILNKKNIGDQSVPEIASKVTSIESLRIGQHEFGPVIFRSLPIEIPVHIDAILGMEFFDQHRVIIDFRNRQLFLQ